MNSKLKSPRSIRALKRNSFTMSKKRGREAIDKENVSPLPDSKKLKVTEDFKITLEKVDITSKLKNLKISKEKDLNQTIKFAQNYKFDEKKSENKSVKGTKEKDSKFKFV
jgi:hypothetical protein